MHEFSNRATTSSSLVPIRARGRVEDNRGDRVPCCELVFLFCRVVPRCWFLVVWSGAALLFFVPLQQSVTVLVGTFLLDALYKLFASVFVAPETGGPFHIAM